MQEVQLKRTDLMRPRRKDVEFVLFTARPRLPDEMTEVMNGRAYAVPSRTINGTSEAENARLRASASVNKPR